MSEENELPNGWVWTSIESIAEIVTGTTPPKIEPDNFGDEIPFVKPGDLDANGPIISATEYLSKKGLLKSRVIPLGSVMVTCIGSIGKVGLSGGNLVTNQQINSMIIFEPIEPRYVYYYCLTYFFQDQMKLKASATTVSILNKSKFSALPMLLAPLTEQHSIVAAIEQQFTRLETGVAALQKAHTKLKRYRAAVLKSAVEGKLTEAWRTEHPTTEPASVLLERLLKERRAKWEADLRAKGKDPAKVKYVEPARPDLEGLPELPEGWCWATMEQVAYIQGGIQKQPSRAPQKNAFPYLRVANVFRDRLDLSVVEKMELFRNELGTFRLEVGDLLIVEGNGSRSEIGRCAVWNGEIDNCVHQNHIIRVRPRHVIPEYLNYYWNSPEGSRRVIDVAGSTSGLYTLSVGKIARLPIPLPSFIEQEQIVTEVEQSLSIINKLEAIVEANLNRAERLRQSILKEAFAGRLVPQDANDEPASVMLERIRKEREGLKKEIVGNGRQAKVSSEPVKIDVEEARQAELWEGVGGW